MMIDLSGYTALTEAHGGLSASKIIDIFEETATKALQGASKIKERVGDEIVIVASKPVDVALTALRFRELAMEKTNFLLVHAGMHYGEIIEKKGSFFGSTINKTSRILALAKKDELLCSSEFAEMLPKQNEFKLKELGDFQFKNLLALTKVFKLKPSNDQLELPIIDPVCKMVL